MFTTDILIDLCIIMTRIHWLQLFTIFSDESIMITNKKNASENQQLPTNKNTKKRSIMKP